MANYNNNEAYANINIPKEMVPFENERCIGVRYYHRDPDNKEEWESGLIFINRKFVKQAGQYWYKVGIVKAWTYEAKTAEGKPIKVPSQNLIFYLINERSKYGGK